MVSVGQKSNEFRYPLTVFSLTSLQSKFLYIDTLIDQGCGLIWRLTDCGTVCSSLLIIWLLVGFSSSWTAGQVVSVPSWLSIRGFLKFLLDGALPREAGFHQRTSMKEREAQNGSHNLFANLSAISKLLPYLYPFEGGWLALFQTKA